MPTQAQKATCLVNDAMNRVINAARSAGSKPKELPS
jgi:hypothetical protein